MRPHVISKSEGAAARAHAVRDLANEARKVLYGEANHPFAVQELLRRIDDVRDEWGDAPAAPIHRWLDNLRREVERV